MSIKTLHVDVTEEDIQQGQGPEPNGHRRCTSCPVAIAATRAVREVFHNNHYTVATSGTDFSVYMNEELAEKDRDEIWKLFKSLPESVYRFIGAADNRKNVKPFDFSVEIQKVG